MYGAACQISNYLVGYTKAALVGTGGDLEHGAAMIHPRLGMAMRRAIKRGRVIIPGHAKVGPPGTTVDLIYGPLDDGWISMPLIRPRC